MSGTPHTCACHNVQLKVAPSQSPVGERKIGDISYHGPYHLISVTAVLPSLLHTRSLEEKERGGVYKGYSCGNCQQAVAAQQGDNGDVWIANAAKEILNVMSYSECFGVHVPRGLLGKPVPLDETTAKAAPDTFQKLTDCLAVYKVKLEDRNEAKIKAFREQLALETKANLEAARRDAEILWATAVNSSPAAAVVVDTASSKPVPTSSNKKASSLGSAAVATKKTSPTRAGQADAAGPSSGRSASDSNALWLMDEEEEPADVFPSPMKDWAPAKSQEKFGDSEDEDNLNTSASGLLPGSRRILFGSRAGDEPLNNNNNNNARNEGGGAKEKVTMAHSVPVSIPMAPRWRTISGNGSVSPGVATDDDEKGGEKFERPDILAANTWQDQVREEWVSRSLRALDEKDRDDLEFLVATKDKPTRSTAQRAGKGI